jgi:restriction endonuclease
VTILEAVKAILLKEPNGLTCKEITSRILSENLYTFNAQDPNAIVGHSLRKHCQGLEFPSAHPIKHFYIVSGKRGTAIYSLLEQPSLASKQDDQKKLPVSSSSDLLPEEKMQKYHNEHKQSVKDQLLDMILNNDPSFFEHLVVKLLLAWGYGYGTDAGKVVGKSHDGGIDGIINEDKLGLDKIYIQAKRYAPTNHVRSKDIQAFSGAMKKVTKGVFITTSSFTKEAKREVQEQVGKQIALIDGAMLTDLMLHYGIGIRSVQTFETYEIDTAFFEID